MKAARWVSIGALAALAACGSDTSMGGVADAGIDARPPDAAINTSVTAYRWSSLRLADPHLWVGSGDVCIDITEPVNNFASNILQLDQSSPPDGLLDGSVALVFRPFNPGPTATSQLTLEVPTCTAPYTSSVCTGTDDTPRYAMTATAQASGTCVDVLPGTIGGRNPDVPTAPCFGTAKTTIGLHFLNADIMLQDAQGGATMNGTKLDNGLIRGFLSLTDANAIMLTAPGYDPTPLAKFLYGGGSCHDSSSHPMGDLDTGPHGELGWYVYVTFTADQAPYIGK
jgi:hypothetical protein